MQAKRSIMVDMQVFFYGLLALLIGRGKSKLAEMDHLYGMDLNRQLRNSTSERQEQHKQDSLVKVGERIKILRSQLSISLLWLATASIISVFTEDIVGSLADSPLLGVLSAFAFGVATLGRLGWFGASMSGDTTVERLDRGLFWVLYWIGMFLATWAVLP
ncbi:MAG: hypothetical protein AB2692_23575 [Candidatus Thiodiazotropha sp.]